MTLGVAAARGGDLDEALVYGRKALTGTRQSLPSLAVVARDLGHVLNLQYADVPEAQEYLEQLRAIPRPA